MKQLSTLRYLLCTLLLTTGAACGGSDERKQDDPQPSHHAQVRYIFEEPSSLSAYISGGSVLPDGTKPENTFADDPVGGPTPRIKDAGAVSSNREFNTTISFEHSRGSRATVGSYFTAEIIVDNVVKKTIRIDHTTALGAAYPTARAVILCTEW